MSIFKLRNECLPAIADLTLQKGCTAIAAVGTFTWHSQAQAAQAGTSGGSKAGGGSLGPEGALTEQQVHTDANARR